MSWSILSYKYLLQVAVCLVEGANQQGGSLDELFVLLFLLLRRKTAADM
jgi:hypothetical protein